jgi:hypothetical protein
VVLQRLTTYRKSGRLFILRDNEHKRLFSSTNSCVVGLARI